MITSQNQARIIEEQWIHLWSYNK